MSGYKTKKVDIPKYWLGENPPSSDFHNSDNPLVGQSGFRENPNLHGVFREVHASEIDLGQLKVWPVILDELIRLISMDNQQSLLVIRFTQSKLLSIFKLANFFRNRVDITYDLVGSESSPDGTTLWKIMVLRKFQRPSLMSFEFSLITNGARNSALLDFIQSVKEIEGIAEIDWGISVCGPDSVEKFLEKNHPDVKFIIEPSQFNDKAWITKKKNLLVEATNRENILVTHDRYKLPRNFLNEMFRFGSDFDVISPAQQLLNGDRFPDKVALNSNWSWSPSMLLSYEDYHPYEYINGGAIIAKTAILEKFPWNEMLFWNQAEDVELSRQLQAHSVVVRNTSNISLEVGEVRENYLDTFLLCPDLVDAYPLVTHNSEFTSQIHLEYASQELIDFKSLENHSDFFRNGIDYFKNDWIITPKGLTSVSEVVDIQIEASENIDLFLIKFSSSPNSNVICSISNGEVVSKSHRLKFGIKELRLKRDIDSRPIRVSFKGATGMTVKSINKLIKNG